MEFVKHEKMNMNDSAEAMHIYQLQAFFNIQIYRYKHFLTLNLSINCSHFVAIKWTLNPFIVLAGKQNV